MVEVTFVALSPEEAEAIESYADVPDDQLLEQFRLPKLSALSELAFLFACSPDDCLVPFKSLRDPKMTLLKAGRRFESGLAGLDEVAVSALFAHKWAQSSWPEDINEFDLTGLLLSLSAVVLEHIRSPRELFVCVETMPA